MVAVFLSLDSNSHIPCISVNVPHKFIGFLPVGPVIINESMQAPFDVATAAAVFSAKSKVSKSSLSWQISEKEKMTNTYFQLLENAQVHSYPLWV